MKPGILMLLAVVLVVTGIVFYSCKKEGIKEEATTFTVASAASAIYPGYTASQTAVIRSYEAQPVVKQVAAKLNFAVFDTKWKATEAECRYYAQTYVMPAVAALKAKYGLAITEETKKLITEAIRQEYIRNKPKSPFAPSPSANYTCSDAFNNDVSDCDWDAAVGGGGCMIASFFGTPAAGAVCGGVVIVQHKMCYDRAVRDANICWKNRGKLVYVWVDGVKIPIWDGDVFPVMRAVYEYEQSVKQAYAEVVKRARIKKYSTPTRPNPGGPVIPSPF
ncbi:MAG TPA: hypothetical protein VK625_13700 [Flavitalea sp.]|nr:hypothetical protein [Flavitalea sp.]